MVDPRLPRSVALSCSVMICPRQADTSHKIVQHEVQRHCLLARFMFCRI